MKKDSFTPIFEFHVKLGSQYRFRGERMKSLFIVLTLLSSLHSFAFSGQDIDQALIQMKATGKFTDAQIEAARAQLKKMSPADMKALEAKAREAAKDPKMQEQAKKLFNQR